MFSSDSFSCTFSYCDWVVVFFPHGILNEYYIMFLLWELGVCIWPLFIRIMSSHLKIYQNKFCGSLGLHPTILTVCLFVRIFIFYNSEFYNLQFQQFPEFISHISKFISKLIWDFFFWNSLSWTNWTFAENCKFAFCNSDLSWLGTLSLHATIPSFFLNYEDTSHNPDFEFTSQIFNSVLENDLVSSLNFAFI